MTKIDIYEYLKKDHQKVADLFKQFSKAKSRVEKTEIVGLIAKELTLHATSEQETFYKVLEKHNESKKEVLHAEKEHRDIEETLKKIVNFDKTDEKWEQEVLALEQIVTHHVKEEEGSLFKIAKEVISEEEAYIIKEKMHDYKEKLLQNL